MTIYVFNIPDVYWEVVLTNEIPFNCFLEGVLKYRLFNRAHPANLHDCVYANVFTYAITESLFETHQLCKENIWWIADHINAWLPSQIVPNYTFFYTQVTDYDLILHVA